MRQKRKLILFVGKAVKHAQKLPKDEYVLSYAGEPGVCHFNLKYLAVIRILYQNFVVPDAGVVYIGRQSVIRKSFEPLGKINFEKLSERYYLALTGMSFNQKQ